MNKAGEWVDRLKAFHEKQLDLPRRVYRLGRTKMVFTGGHAACTVGAAVAAVSLDSPDLVFWIAVVTGFAGGKYLYPIPRSSVATRYGSREISRKASSELDCMTPTEIRAYQFNSQLTHEGVSLSTLGTEEALGRHIEAVAKVSQSTGADTELLANLSLSDVTEHGTTAARHDLLKRRWLTYELDPQRQFDFPMMSDASFPPTAAMIRAMRAAEQERTAGISANYKLAVNRFSHTLKAAERAAGVP
ncbi:hypothetical protein P4U43_00385 [Arthrobacter sp. EH-1B-1]|uniref:Uncharacterized protein n=1 Tax=Arthrobacter vasquezii TaxID=2977629 RepID=A0ABT6CQN8_9MICC|nr:hypothetical protein [Arthrobacter vasquezii]MDF9276245.1 hypothetical protein [Arthrobacter vasquezii]